MQNSEAPKRSSKTRRAKAKFTLSEDALLKSLVDIYGEENWEEVASNIKGRNPRQCKDRWFFYLSPHLNHSPWTQEEEAKLVTLVNEVGPHWVKIAKYFDGRTDTQIKNKWNVIKRKMEADVPISIPIELISEQSEPIKQYMYVKDKAAKAAAIIKKQKSEDEKQVELLHNNCIQETDHGMIDLSEVSRLSFFDVFQDSFFNNTDDLYFY